MGAGDVMYGIMTYCSVMLVTIGPEYSMHQECGFLLVLLTGQVMNGVHMNVLHSEQFFACVLLTEEWTDNFCSGKSLLCNIHFL
jgi:hypothetical protein